MVSRHMMSVVRHEEKPRRRDDYSWCKARTHRVLVNHPAAWRIVSQAGGPRVRAGGYLYHVQIKREEGHIPMSLLSLIVLALLRFSLLGLKVDDGHGRKSFCFNLPRRYGMWDPASMLERRSPLVGFKSARISHCGKVQKPFSSQVEVSCFTNSRRWENHGHSNAPAKFW